MELEYCIKSADLEHILLLPVIERKAAAIFPLGRIPEEMANDTLLESDFLKGRENGCLWVALSGRVVVGFCLLKRVNEAAILAEVDVLPAHQRQGLGKSLVQEAQKYSDKHEIPLYLTTFDDLAWNAPFYRGLGFRALSAGQSPGFMRELIGQELRAGFKNRIIMVYRQNSGQTAG